MSTKDWPVRSMPLYVPNLEELATGKKNVHHHERSDLGKQNINGLKNYQRYDQLKFHDLNILIGSIS